MKITFRLRLRFILLSFLVLGYGVCRRLLRLIGNVDAWTWTRRLLLLLLLFFNSFLYLAIVEVGGSLHRLLCRWQLLGCFRGVGRECAFSYLWCLGNCLLLGWWHYHGVDFFCWYILFNRIYILKGASCRLVQGNGCDKVVDPLLFHLLNFNWLWNLLLL